MNESGAQAIIDITTTAADPYRMVKGNVYAAAVPAGGTVQVIDLDKDEYLDHPRRKTGRFIVRDVASFIAYLGKHAEPFTEVWADSHTPRRLTPSSTPTTATVRATRGGVTTASSSNSAKPVRGKRGSHSTGK